MNEFKIYYMFRRWLETYELDDNYPAHYLNAQKAVKQDLADRTIKKNSNLHQALRELFMEKKPKDTCQ